MNFSIAVSLSGLILFAAFTMSAYYTGISRIEEIFPDVTAPGSLGIIAYFSGILIPLIAYLYMKSVGKNREVSWMSAMGYFLWVLFMTSWFTFAHVGANSAVGPQNFWSGIQLFFHIFKYLLFLAALALVFVGSGTWILRKIKLYESFSESLRIPLALGIGWSAFVLKLSVVGFFWQYNLWAFYGLVIVTIALAYREILEVAADLPNHSFRIGKDSNARSSVKSPNRNRAMRKVSDVLEITVEEDGETSGGSYDTLRLMINCLLLVTLFVVLTTNLVNIVRPYPIGWDDLGVYMNYPKLMALSESTSHYGIALWQTFTGIGFLHKSATFAFFLNQFGSILAIAGTWAGIRYFTKKDHPVVSLPLLATTVFMGLPMIVFQQAKDMKLDSGLFGISVMAVMALFLAFYQKEPKTRNVWYVVAGALIGIAFSIKVTTLMLIVASFSALFYRSLGITGFFGFLAMFIGLFTNLRLWDLMNVNYPKDSPDLITFWTGTILFGIALSLLSLKLKNISKEEIFQNLMVPFVLVGIGFSLTMGPWLAKNVIEGAKIGQVNMMVMLWGDAKAFVPDYTKILSTEEIGKINETLKENAINKDGKTLNEDLGRYFGYQTGLNNYLILPKNLTVQANQKGEFTDISYIFLALLPGILLLRYRNGYLKSAYGIYLFSLFVLYFFNVPSINALLSVIQLPVGYAFVIAISVLPFILLHIDGKTSEKSEEDSLFLTFFAFITTYCLIFLVAAYGIVWYGIYMYFGFLAIITMSVNSERFSLSQKALVGWVVTLIALPYLLVSVIPHAWNNLPEDGMEFKVWKTSEFEGIFQGRPEYIKVMEKFNLRDVSIARDKILKTATNPDLKLLLENYAQSSIGDIVLGLELAQRLGAEKQTPQYQALALDARKVKEYAYEQILYPSEDNRNTDTIYRMGTFLTYYISQNRSRFYEDSLITQFGTYFKGKDIDTTAENMKKIGIKYLLVDLNAATIDQDPRHDLTRRYEEILDFIRSDKVRLVATDSLCLQIALDLKEDKNYMNLAGTNYVSYVNDGSGVEKAILPKDKTDFCSKVLAQIIMENRVSEKEFGYLKPMNDYVKSRNAKTQEEAAAIILPYIGRTWMGAFELLP